MSDKERELEQVIDSIDDTINRLGMAVHQLKFFTSELARKVEMDGDTAAFMKTRQEDVDDAYDRFKVDREKLSARLNKYLDR